MKKAALHNLGCKVNAYETEAMQHLLEEAGYEIVPFTQKADVYVINTCSVTNMADRKSRQMRLMSFLSSSGQRALLPGIDRFSFFWNCM